MSIDEQYRQILKAHIDDPQVIKDLGAFARRMYATRTLAHFEVYKQVATVPGDIVELGVYKGESLLNFARFLEILNPGDRAKRVIGFDHWKGLRNFTAQDGAALPHVDNQEGGWNPEHFHQTLLQLIDLFHQDSFVPKKARIELVDGDIRESVFEYVKQHPGLRIALLHCDCDLYEPTLAGLQALYPHVVTGGIVLFDEYAIREWPGESKAVDEYFNGRPPKMQKLPWSGSVGGWFVKGAA